MWYSGIKANMKYGEIVNKSIEVVRKNKWLWIFGAITGSGAGIGNWQNLSGENKFKDVFDGLKTGNSLPHGFPSADVLGAYTNVIKEWFWGISPIIWFLIITGILIFSAAAIAVWMVFKAYAKASLIWGVESTLNGEVKDLAAISVKGREKNKNLILFWLISVGIFLPAAATWFILTFFLADSIVKYILLFVFVLSVMIFGLLNIMISIYGERLIVLKEYSPWEAWKKGLKLAYSNFFATLFMGIINFIIKTIAGILATVGALIVTGIPIIVFAYPYIKYKIWPSWQMMAIPFVFLVFFILIEILAGAIGAVFADSNWNQVFKEVIARDKNEK